MIIDDLRSQAQRRLLTIAVIITLIAAVAVTIYALRINNRLADAAQEITQQERKINELLTTAPNEIYRVQIQSLEMENEELRRRINDLENDIIDMSDND